MWTGGEATLPISLTGAPTGSGLDGSESLAGSHVLNTWNRTDVVVIPRSGIRRRGEPLLVGPVGPQDHRRLSVHYLLRAAHRPRVTPTPYHHAQATQEQKCVLGEYGDVGVLRMGSGVIRLGLDIVCGWCFASVLWSKARSDSWCWVRYSLYTSP